MALPSKDDLELLGYAHLGVPYVDVEAKSNLNTDQLGYAFLGVPFVGAQTAAATGSTAPKTLAISILRLAI